jgi:hypothetical protein
MAALAPQAAFADTPEPSVTETIGATMPMTVVGYDEKVAEANGYQIVTHDDGSQESVPVTAAAKTEQAAADAARAQARGEVDGDCGSSWINALKKENDTVAFSTGYVVFGAVVDSQWQVIANGFISGNSVTLYPGSNSGTWSTEGALPSVIGPGIASVGIASSFAILAGGQVCYSGGPSASFG